jgi:hypothetical protein
MFCPKCAEEVSITAGICPHCKQFLGGKPEDAPKQKEALKPTPAKAEPLAQPVLATPVAQTAPVLAEQKATPSVTVAPKNGLAIVAFIFSFVLPGLLPFIMGIVALKRAKKRAGKGKGLSIAAIILSILGGIASVVVSLAVAFLLVGLFTSMAV